ncbi:ComF family protein [Pseudoflavonifractor phocaeensis]|uniref:ComF family protein n=1 Tax=Pseudoflavonifractor phocaeensis TaxID=1870988 RepID=UPI001F2003D6|nr:phosphoribosyltransferase family protein [Pseudoflavonifractor phocaeensis]
MKLLTGALGLLFPVKCPFCQTILEDPEAPLCPECQTRLPWLLGREAERKVDFADGCFSALAYRDRVPEAVRRYKFARVRACGRPFGLLAAQCAQDHLPQRPDALTWAPLSDRRLRERGFDQAELMARAAGAAMGLPVIPTLKKLKHTKAQSDLTDPRKRRANVQGAYALLPGAEVAGRRLLLVDDVVTTGATLGECAKVLLMGGADRIWCATLAQARGTGEEGKN